MMTEDAYERADREQEEHYKNEIARGSRKRRPASRTSPLQRAQRDRQSTLYPMEGAISNLKVNLHKMFMQPELFTESEKAIARDLWKVLESHRNWRGNWEEIKKNLVSSVDNPEGKV
jgi:hypothetical protein